MPLDYVICGTRRWQAMSDEQKARANCLVLEIRAGNPAFLHILKYTHLHKRPSIVSLFFIFVYMSGHFLYWQQVKNNTYKVNCSCKIYIARMPEI